MPDLNFFQGDSPVPGNGVGKGKERVFGKRAGIASLPSRQSKLYLGDWYRVDTGKITSCISKWAKHSHFVKGRIPFCRSGNGLEEP